MGRKESTLLFEEDEATYTYLLGLYLGDGHIARMGRTSRLRLFLDAAYPGIVVQGCEALATISGNWPTILRCRDRRMFVVHAYSVHWPVFFPQHGPGRKHERPIRLAPWQDELVADHAASFVRGLMHSDGSRYVARQRSVAGKDYFYARYGFSNRSDDILELMSAALDSLAIRHRRTGWHVDVNRRDDVASLDRVVGPKR